MPAGILWLSGLQHGIGLTSRPREASVAWRSRATRRHDDATQLENDHRNNEKKHRRLSCVVLAAAAGKSYSKKTKNEKRAGQIHDEGLPVAPGRAPAAAAVLLLFACGTSLRTYPKTDERRLRTACDGTHATNGSLLRTTTTATTNEDGASSSFRLRLVVVGLSDGIRRGWRARTQQTAHHCEQRQRRGLTTANDD